MATSITPPRLCLAAGVALAALAVVSLEGRGGMAAGVAVLQGAGLEGGDALGLYFSWWPRLAMALLGGGGLALAGVLMQQTLRNPLAAPTTLGVASGAHLGLMAATLMAPGLLAFGREWAALLGAGAATGLVFLLAWRQGLAPVVVVLAGLVVNLYLSAVGMALLLFHHEELKGLLIWGAGSLPQNGWSDTLFLAPRVGVGAAAAAVLLRPLALLDLDDASAHSLGASVRSLRLAGLGVAVFLTACVVSVLGVIGFIGLAAPNIVRLAGARRLGARLGWGGLLGALLLAITDLLVQQFAGTLPTALPTGATTAALGAPLLLWLIPRLQLQGGAPPRTPGTVGRRHPAPRRLALGMSAGLAAVTILALSSGQSLEGWQWGGGLTVEALPWRLPRLLAAAGSGVLLAVAGTLIQRVSGNPLASPEVLGISGGSAIAVMLVLMLAPGAGQVTLLAAGTTGAVAVLALLVALNARSGFLPERLLLTGVAVTALFDAVRSFVLAGGDPRGQQMLAWLSGSTYYVGWTGGVTVAVAALILAVAARPFARWLDILPLGAATARSLGIAVDRARLVLLALVALLTACATLVVGPLSFVGLLAPHMARLMGFSRARGHLLGAALTGAVLMVLADWLGRQLLFPQEIPAGVVASLVGGAYFMWSLRRFG